LPDATDVLQFNHGAAVTVTAVPVQTIGRLVVTNNTLVTLQTGGATTLTIAGGVDADLVVDAGSALNLTGANALSVTLGATATGSISGSMTLAGAGHRLISGAANGITFNSGSQFTTGTAFSGSPFGTTSLNSVIFASGSTYNHNAGGNPFGASQPSSVVVFQTGSLYRHLTSGAPAFSGRTYANFELNFSGGISPSGTASVSIDNLIITVGTLNFNMTGTPGHAIKGNITVAAVATLNFAPTTAGTVNLSGTALQTISGGGTITAGANSSLIINNTAGVVLDNTASLHNVTIPAGSALTVNPNHNLTVAGTLTNLVAGNSGLVLRSGASLIHSTANIAATMERNIPSDNGWRFISSPVAAQPIQPNFVPAAPLPTDFDFFRFDQSSSTHPWINIRAAANALNPTFEINFVLGQGYLVQYGTAYTPLRSFAGTLNQGDISVPLAFTTNNTWAGWNLLGNPYPSAIDWNSAVRTAFADNFAYIYNPLLGGGGGYEFVNGANAGALIAPNQGFFVLANAAGTFTFTNAMRASGAVAFKSEPVVENMILRLSQGNFYNQTTLALVNDSRWERDRNDALKFFSFNSAMPQLFSQSADQVQLAVNSVPLVNQSSEFTLGLRAPAAGQYTLSLQTSNGVFAQGDVFVRDLLTGAVHNLRQNPQFAFHATQGDHAARFKVSFTQPTTVGNLPQGTTAIYVHNNILHLNFASDESNRQLQVFDISGRVVKSQRLQDGASQSIPLALEMGTYIVRITDSKGVATQRVMVR